MINWNLEQAERDMLFSMAKDGDVFYDIGANEGMYSIDFASRFKGKVYAFEPIPATREELLQRVGNLNVCVYPFGLSDFDGVATFFTSPLDSGATSMAPLESERFGIIGEVDAEVRRLDAIVQHRVPPPNLIKCDVEGAELLVFRGAEQTLSSCRPIIQCELHRKWMSRFGHHPNDLIAFMAALKYSCFVLRGGKLEPFPVMNDDVSETNFYFLPEKML